jgi:proline dehydrogenase
MISFDNTEVAFGYKSDKDLKRAYRLFTLVGKPWLVRIGKWFTPIAFKLRLPVSGLIKRTIFRQFCGGETIDDCDDTIALLHKHGVGTILDYSVEGKVEEDDFDATCEEIIATLEKAKGNKAIPFAVFKVSGISRHGLLEKINDDNIELTDSERLEFADVALRVDRICGKAAAVNTPVFIDAEETWIQNTIDRLALSMMKKYNTHAAIVFNTVQMYRHDRLAYLKDIAEIAQREEFFLGIKLVRGAYMEKERERAQEKRYPSPIQADKASCDRDFDAALRFMVDRIEIFSICAGTHNENSSAMLAELIQEKGLESDDKRLYFAQLLGMSDHISFNLSNAGYLVAKYVPYGPVKEVMPYLLRRADENTSVAGQTSRELGLLIKEVKRRKAFSGK